MKQLSPQQVVGGFNRRESKAMSWIYHEYRLYVFDIVETLTHGSPDTEDLVGEVFIRLLKFPGQFDKLKTIRYFLFNTAKNACLNYNRHQQLVNARSEEVDLYYPYMNEDSLEEVETIAECRNAMYRAIKKLPPHSQQIILLGYIEGLSNAEIAKRLGFSEKTVANYKTKALKTLKAEILKMGGHFLFLLYFLQ